jgi:hypothetical protein
MRLNPIPSTHWFFSKFRNSRSEPNILHAASGLQFAFSEKARPFRLALSRQSTVYPLCFWHLSTACPQIAMRSVLPIFTLDISYHRGNLQKNGRRQFDVSLFVTCTCIPNCPFEVLSGRSFAVFPFEQLAIRFSWQMHARGDRMDVVECGCLRTVRLLGREATEYSSSFPRHTECEIGVRAQGRTRDIVVINGPWILAEFVPAGMRGNRRVVHSHSRDSALYVTDDWRYSNGTA